MFYIYFFQDYFYGISIFLHYLFTSSLCCQLNMPAALCAELSWKYCQKEFKAFLISKCVTTIIKNSIRFSSSSISCLFTTSKLDLGLLKSKTNINAQLHSLVRSEKNTLDSQIIISENLHQFIPHYKIFSTGGGTRS